MWAELAGRAAMLRQLLLVRSHARLAPLARFEIRYISQCVPISIGQVVAGPQARGSPPTRHWPLATVG